MKCTFIIIVHDVVILCILYTKMHTYENLVCIVIIGTILCTKLIFGLVRCNF